MPWFSNKKSEGPDATSREDRQRCWESRDAYFTCLDTVHVVKPGDEEAHSACGDVRAAYHKNCAKSWIAYFDQRRVLAEQQQGILSQAKQQADTPVGK